MTDPTTVRVEPLTAERLADWRQWVDDPTIPDDEWCGVRRPEMRALLDAARQPASPDLTLDQVADFLDFLDDDTIRGLARRVVALDGQPASSDLRAVRAWLDDPDWPHFGPGI